MIERSRPGRTDESLDLENVLRPSGALLEAHTAVGRAIEELAVSRSDYDATTLSLLVRLRLAPRRQLRGVDLCRQLLKSKSHVSRVIDRAERAGLVRRRPDPHDRRGQRITLTPAGEDAVGAAVPYVVDVVRQIFHDTLAPEEIDTLIDLLTRVSKSAQNLSSESPHPRNRPLRLTQSYLDR